MREIFRIIALLIIALALYALCANLFNTQINPGMP